MDILAIGLLHFIASDQAAGSSDIVPTLLTGGGFAVLAAIIGGGFAWLNNRTTAAKSIAEGSREYVEGAREELKQAREDLKQARTELDAKTRQLESARRDLTDARASIRAGQNERARLKTWIQEQCIANAEHKVWDDELQLELQRCGVHIRVAPPLMVTPPKGDT